MLRERGLRLLYDAPRRGTVRLAGQLHPPQGRRRRAGRAGRARTRPTPALTTIRHTGCALRLPVGRFQPSHRSTDQEHDRAAHPRRHPGRRHHRRGLRRPSSSPSPTAPSPSTRTRSTCSRASPAKEKDPRKSLHVDEVALPELGPGEALRRGDGLARSTTTPCGPRSSSRSRPSASSSATAGSRRWPSGTTCPTTSSAPTWPASCCETGAGRAQVEARRPGRRALPLGRAGGPRRPQRHDARPRAADLGLRDQLRRPRRRRAGQGQPADAQARAPDLGGGRLPRPGQLHGVPPAGQQERRRHEAGRQRPDLGRLRRPRRLRDAVRPQRRRHPGLRGLQRGEGRDLPHHGRRADHQPLRGGLPVLEGRAHPGPEGVEAPRRQDPRAHRRRGHRHRLRAPRPRDLRRQRSSSPARAARSPPARRPRATCTSTTTATCG